MWKDLPRGAKWGFVAALFLTKLSLVSALWSPLVGLAYALVFGLAARGLRRGNPWSGYGAALFLAVSMLAGMVSAGVAIAWDAMGVGLALYGVPVLLLVIAGRSLSRSGRRSSSTGWIAVTAATLLFLLTIRVFVIPTSSMANTLLPGDRLLVRQVLLGQPERGDVVVFRYPVNPQQQFIMRVAAVGGDRVRFDQKRLLVNGREVAEPYVTHQSGYLDLFRDNFPREPSVQLPGSWGEDLPRHVVDGELVVPHGKYFVLGDNRDQSLDSRWWGFVEKPDIVGKPMLVFFSAERQPGSMRPVILEPGKIRWGRTFRLL